MSTIIKNKLNTINTNLDDIDESLKGAKKKISDALLYNEVGKDETFPNDSSVDAYLTFEKYAELIKSLKTRTSPMKLIFNIDHTQISSSAGSTAYKRTVVLPIRHDGTIKELTPEKYDELMLDIISKDTYVKPAAAKAMNVASVDSSVNEETTDIFGNICKNGLIAPNEEDVKKYLNSYQIEEFNNAVDTLGDVVKRSPATRLNLSDAEADYNYIVDWGDGTNNQYNAGDTLENNLDAIFHTYAEEGYYMVQITGNFRCLYGNPQYFTQYVKDHVVQYDKDGVYLNTNENLAMHHYLVEIRSFGQNLLRNCDFAFCNSYNLTTIPTDLEVNAFKEIKSAYAIFCNTGLTAIPYDDVFDVGLFSGCDQCQSFSRAFQNCRSITSNLPVKLFDGCSSVVTLSYCFCNSLIEGCLIDGVEKLSPRLFNGMTSLKNISGMFQSCSKMHCSITDSELFKDCLSLTNVAECFQRSSVTGTVQKSLFPIKYDSNGNEDTTWSNNITSVQSLFDSTGISAIDADALTYFKKDGVDFYRAFYNTALTTIPANFVIPSAGSLCDQMFANNTILTSIDSNILSSWKLGTAKAIFAKCSVLTSALPAANPDWNSYNTIKKWFCAFSGCTKMSDYSTIALELGGNGPRKFTDRKVGSIVLADDTTVDPSDFTYDSSNKPVGVVYADEYISESASTYDLSNNAGNVDLSESSSSVRTLFVTALNHNSFEFMTIKGNPISGIPNNDSQTVFIPLFKYNSDGTQTQQPLRLNGETYTQYIRQYIFEHGFYDDATPNSSNEFVFATAKGTYTKYKVISSTSVVTSGDATTLYFVKDSADNNFYNAYVWSNSTLVANADYDVDITSMNTPEYPVLNYVNNYSSDNHPKGTYFLADVGDFYDMHVENGLMKNAVDKIIASSNGDFTTSNTYTPDRYGESYITTSFIYNNTPTIYYSETNHWELCQNIVYYYYTRPCFIVKY